MLPLLPASCWGHGDTTPSSTYQGLPTPIQALGGLENLFGVVVACYDSPDVASTFQTVSLANGCALHFHQLTIHVLLDCS